MSSGFGFDTGDPEAFKDAPLFRELQRVMSSTSGPVKTWNHTLTFTPIDSGACRYSDRVEIAAGPMTPLVAAFAALIYRYRQARWRRLARILA